MVELYIALEIDSTLVMHPSVDTGRFLDILEVQEIHGRRSFNALCPLHTLWEDGGSI